MPWTLIFSSIFTLKFNKNVLYYLIFFKNHALESSSRLADFIDKIKHSLNYFELSVWMNVMNASAVFNVFYLSFLLLLYLILYIQGQGQSSSVKFAETNTINVLNKKWTYNSFLLQEVPFKKIVILF